jgi:imidazolonepropionase-like amidohydrolase
LLRSLHAGGVKILTGTDLSPWVGGVPGFAVHDELRLLVAAGLSPADALRAATLNPALFFNATDSLGAVKRGRLADLVLLDANPLEEIRNSLRINAVFSNGRFYDRAALDRLLGQAQAVAAAVPVQ